MPSAVAAPPERYRPKNASNPLKEVVEDHLDELVGSWDAKFRAEYGPFHPRVKDLLERFTRCGDPHFGFMRLHCDACGEERFVPHSCKARGICPSCGQKRAIAWAERVVEEVLPHTRYVQLVFTIPRLLRKAFLFKRELYGELCRIAYTATREFFQAHYRRLEDPLPAMLAVPQSHGTLLNANAHCHALCSLGVYDREGKFYCAPEDLDFSPLEEIFREKTFKMLLEHEATTPERVEMLRSWRHSGFSVNASRRAGPGEPAELEKMLQYLLRPPISLRRLDYDANHGTVTYRGKYNPALGRDYQHVSAMEFLAMLVPHILLRFECSIYYFGALSTTLRRKFGWLDSAAPPQSETSSEQDEESEFVRQRRKTWARLIAKTWLANPELCPRCGEKMRVVSAISSPAQDDVIEKILRQIGLWDPPWRRQRKARAPPEQTDFFTEESYSQLEPEGDDEFNQDLHPAGEHWGS